MMNREDVMTPRAPALVAGCSKAGLAIIRALGARGIPVVGLTYGRGQIAQSSRYLQETVRAADPAKDEPAFIACLIRAAQLGLRDAVLFPSDDASLVAIARHRQSLAKYFRIVAEHWELVQALIEKHRTYAIAHDAGVPYPKLQMVQDPSAAVSFAREIGYPCLLKLSVSHLFFKRFGCKMLMLHSEAELVSGVRRVSGYGGGLMLCEFIPGPDSCGANYNSFCVGGRPLQEFTAQKVRLKPTFIGFPTVARSAYIREVQEAGRRMAAALQLNGFSCMEFKRDVRDGVYKLMEVNARHIYSGSLATACGIDFPYLSYRAARGMALPPARVEPAPELFWIDEERDVLGTLHALWRDPRGAREHLAPYLRRKVCAVTSLSDPKPALSLFKASLGRAFKRIRAPLPGPAAKA
jgi:predicted ATP-grasp superfamily ATP-dependent carboligase